MPLLKVEGAGNDFLAAFGDWAERLAGAPDLVARLCHRRFGVGADGVLLLAADAPNRLRLDYHNADGSWGAFCANGTRCAARVGVERLGLKPSLVVDTGRGAVPAQVSDDGVTLDLAQPEQPARQLELAVAGRSWRVWWMLLGVPHVILRCTDLDSVDIEAVAAPLRRHPDLGPDGANVHLVAAIGTGRLAIRSWERGVEGETLACGSGMVAAALVEMAEHGLLQLECVPRSGLSVAVEAVGEPPSCPSRLFGPARVVAEVEPGAEWLDDGCGGTQ